MALVIVVVLVCLEISCVTVVVQLGVAEVAAIKQNEGKTGRRKKKERKCEDSDVAMGENVGYKKKNCKRGQVREGGDKGVKSGHKNTACAKVS
jgi:hypothetical protein